MSNFRSKAFNPASKRVEVAEYCDDYYGRHRYGIRFDDGCVHPEAQCGIDAAATAIDSLLKERDALEARVKELEGFVLDEQLSHGRTAKAAREEVARAEQERDEAYERAASKAYAEVIKFTSSYGHWPEAHSIAQGTAAAIRRLAGPEKEKKE